jgi:hypothetical protein
MANEAPPTISAESLLRLWVLQGQHNTFLYNLLPAQLQQRQRLMCALVVAALRVGGADGIVEHRLDGRI